MYWFLQILFVLLCVVATSEIVKYNRAEQILRQKYGVNYVENEIIFQGDQVYKVLSLGFLGGCAAGGIGLGGGTIYNPVLLHLGMHPKVSSATSMYLVMFTSFNVCVINFINHTLDIKYGLVLAGCNVIGSLAGLMLAERGKRQSSLVFALGFIFLISVCINPYTSYIDLSM